VAQRASGGPSQLALEANPQLFATMCALYAAGYAQDESLIGSNPVRRKIADQMARVSGPATDALRQFYRDHLLADPAANLSRYISFALVAGSPPKFAYRVTHDDLPPDVLPIEGFNEILANFYAEAHLDRLWQDQEQEYDREVALLTSPVSRIVLTATSYLREILQSSNPRTFAVYVEPLVGQKTNFRNYGEHYAIVASGGQDPPLEEIRHAFLHYLLEPLTLRYAAQVAEKRSLLTIAARAPRLPAEYREDFLALFTECLVRAVELRLRRLPAAQCAAALDQADAEGFILIRPINTELVKFEQAEPAMDLYFPDLVRGINPTAEGKRLQAAVFAPVEQAPASPQAQAPESSELETWLQEGERAIAAGNAPAAEAAFQRVLGKYANQPRALYGLAITSVLQGKALRARDLFLKLVSPSAANVAGGTGPAQDPLILAWSHVYLGRLYDVNHDRDSALKEYRAALGVDGAPESARLAAQRGLEKPYGPTPKNPGEGQPKG
jgi:tetratricopeptide (TPR) repeat protein